MTGLGLGLSIVKTLVELHGGTIAVDSELGHGTEFSIIMPSITRRADTPDGRPVVDRHDEQGKRLVNFPEKTVVDIHRHVRYK